MVKGLGYQVKGKPPATRALYLKPHAISRFKKLFEGNAAKQKRRELKFGSPSLRRHYPDQVLRVLSQPAAIAESTPRTLSRTEAGYCKCSTEKDKFL
jgi:hypothetical protein